MLGPSMLGRDDLPSEFAAYPRYGQHVGDRPWCVACLEHERRKEEPPCVGGKSWGRSIAVKGDDGGSAFENLVRTWEETKS